MSLFPSSSATVESTPPASAASTSETTDAAREEVRQWVRTAMKNGELDSEPEMTLGKHSKVDDNVRWDSDVDGSDDAGDVEDIADAGDGKDAEVGTLKVKDKSQKKKSKSQSKGDVVKPEESNLTLKGDDFFDSD